MVKREKPHPTPPMTKRCPAHRHFDESVAKWSGVEKSPPLMVRAALRREISRLRVSSKRFPSVPIPTCSPARDDGVGEQHTVISEGDEPHSRHFDRSEAEWRNLTPLMVRAALRREISRLRVSSKRFPSAPYRHMPPLEMTVAAGTPIVISTVAERSGEISLHQ